MRLPLSILAFAFAFLGLPRLAAGAQPAPLPAPDTRGDVHPHVRADRDGNFVFRNRHLVAVLARSEGQFGSLVFYPARRPTQPSARPIALAPLLLQATWREGEQTRSAALVPTEVRTAGDDTLRLRGTLKEGAVEWQTELTLTIGESPWLTWSASAVPSAPASLVRFAPVSLRTAATAPSQVLFPGVLYQEGDRAPEDLSRLYVPNPYQVPVPLIAVTHERTTLALMWDAQQAWGGPGHPTALFGAVEDQDLGAAYRMELSVPSVPGYVREGEEGAAQPFEVPAGQAVRLSGKVLVLRDEPNPAAAVRQWVDAFARSDRRGYPRRFEQVREQARQAYLRTLWDPTSSGWHRLLSPVAPPPQPYAFNVLALLMEAGLTSRDSAAQELRQRAESVLSALRTEGALDPRLAYRVGGVLPSLDFEYARVQELIRLQLPGGVWPWEIQAPDQPDLGLEVGMVTERALSILRYAVLTGDSDAAGAGRRALEYMAGRFRVPRAGLQGEVPLRAPDLLAAAQAAECFLLGYQVSGEQRYMEQARFWADAGLPFVYLWGQENRPALKYATLPTFRTTEAAQWAGLRYAYVLRALHEVRPDGLYDRVSEGILSSAMRQQETTGEHAGLIPERWNVESGRPVGGWVGPEELLTLVYRLMGYDPEVSHARVRSGADRLFVASGATILEANTSATRLRLKLKWIKNQDTFTTITGVLERPIRIEYNEHPLRSYGIPFSRRYLPEATEESQLGWYYDAENALLIIRHRHERGADDVEIRWPDPRERTPVDRVDTRIRPRR